MDFASRQAISRRAAHDGDEQDAFAACHTALIWRPGQRATIKTRAARRDRRNTRRALRTGR